MPTPSSPTGSLSDDTHRSGLLIWAYWLTLGLSILAAPLSGFYLLLLLSYEGTSTMPLTGYGPLAVAVVAWVTFDILARAYRGREQRRIWYLSLVLLIQCLTVLGFLPSVVAGTSGSGLAYVCAVLAGIATGATAQITLKAVGERG